MPRDSSGNYTLPAGNPVVAGTAITPTWGNNTLNDVKTVLTASLDRSGNGGMLAGLPAFAGTKALPGYAFSGAISSGWYLAGTNDIRFSLADTDELKFTVGTTTFSTIVNVGVDDTGYDVQFFGATSGKSLLWDESADTLIVTGTTTLIGTVNLDAVDIDGNVQLDGTLTVGVNDTGYDVKFFGATAGKSMLWDESADTLNVTGTVEFDALKGTGAITITNILDEDNMASDSATALATQQSIKAYVDSSVGAADSWAESLAVAVTSGANSPSVASGQALLTNTINETTGASGVTIDSVLLKDNTVLAGTLLLGAGSVTDSSGAISFGNENLTTTGTLGVTGLLTATGGLTSGGAILSDADSTDSLGSTGVRWLKGWFDTLQAGTLVAGAGSITDTSGAISFGNENLSTTGTLGSGAITATGTSLAAKLGVGIALTEGTLHVHTASAGSVTARAEADDLIVESSSNTGISILGSDASNLSLIWGSPTDNKGMVADWNHDGDLGRFGTHNVGASLALYGDDFIPNLTLSGASGSELATFAGGLRTTSAGTSNLRLGLTAGDSIVSGGNYNTLVGDNAGTAITSGDYNVALGFNAAPKIIGGVRNIAVGAYANQEGTSGDDNVYVGYAAGAATTTSSDNTALGSYALTAVTSGANNLALGKDAGRTGSPGGNITTASNEILLGDENVTAANIQVDWTIASDQRDKTDFTALDLGLDFVKALAPVTYKWDKRSKYGDKTSEDYDLAAQAPDGTHKEDWLDIGFKAQEVEALEIAAGYSKDTNTNLVSNHTGDGKQMGLQYSKFVPILVKAIQEQQDLIESLTARITTLEG